MNFLALFGEPQFSTLLALIIKLVVFVVIAFYIIPKQLKEVLRPRDGLTALRWQILILLSVSVFTSIPSAMYQIVRFVDPYAAYELLRAIATVTNNISSLIIVILLVLIFNYKRKN